MPETSIVETRRVWVPLMTPPEGYRFLHNDIGGTGYWSLWTAAPEGYPVPMDGKYPYIWIESLPHDERRFCTAWERIP